MKNEKCEIKNKNRKKNQQNVNCRKRSEKRVSKRLTFEESFDFFRFDINLLGISQSYNTQKEYIRTNTEDIKAKVRSSVSIFPPFCWLLLV